MPAAFQNPPAHLSAGAPVNAPLPPAPATLLDEAGLPHFGQFAGSIASLDWSGLAQPYRRSAWWQRLHHKRWQYVALATEQIFCGVAIVDVGWTNTAFAYVFDRQQRRLLGSFSQDGLPGLTAHLNHCPADGAASYFRLLGNSIRFWHDAQQQCYQLIVDAGGCQIQAQLLPATAAPSLLAIGTVADSVHATCKSAGMPLRGEVRVGQHSFSLDQGCGSYDYSNGFLERETSWRWASAHDAAIGFNLQSGYFGDQENALWLDGQLIPLARADFEYDAAQPMRPWHITTADGLLDLHFHPEGMRAENKNLLIAASRYVQPIGTFEGWVRASPEAAPRRISQLAGVTEDHFSRW